jgi:hypothetical protein
MNRTDERFSAAGGQIYRLKSAARSEIRLHSFSLAASLSQLGPELHLTALDDYCPWREGISSADTTKVRNG